tara:strand:- start:182 stop:640 length:459 start_codon:yes stop_codon:yes gene_type:complete
MPKTYIKNRGVSQTLYHNNNKNHFNETNWDVEYDGNVANVTVKSNADGEKQTTDFSFDNDDLAEMLNMPSVNGPIDQRLQEDFSMPEIDDGGILTRSKFLSSPLPDDEFFVQHSFTKKKKKRKHSSTKHRHKRKTQKIYKKHKTKPKTKIKI